MPQLDNGSFVKMGLNENKMKLNPLSVLDENAERNVVWKLLSVNPAPRTILTRKMTIYPFIRLCL